MSQIEDCIREKAQNPQDADELMELIRLAFEGRSQLISKIEEIKDGVLND
jgi:hypothetical protein